ncbi:response regulator [Puniceicoccaceae bacterium K14]|nr:response regulator [Puniceicoccaceae bacterium K14]
MNTHQENSVQTPENELKVLIVEDSKIEAKFTANLLKKNGYAVVSERVETAVEMNEALNNRKWDIIISDYQMPDFCGMEALKIFMEREIDIPFILVSGKIGEETAVDLMKMGAHDYIMKGNTARLIPAIKSHLKQAASRRDKKRLENALRESEAQYRGFFENAAIGIFRCTEQGTLTDANLNLAQSMGYEGVQDFIRSAITLVPEIHNPDTREAHTVSIREQAEVKGNFEGIFHRKDGSIMEANINVWALRDESGSISYLEGTIEDITERKQIERKLREMEQLHESIIDLTSNL